MRKIFALTLNENAKLWGQIGFRIVMIILAAIVVLMPFGMKLIDYFINDMFGFSPDLDYYLDWAEECREAGDEVGARYYEAEAAVLRFYYDRELDEESLEYYATSEDYRTLVMARLFVEMIGEGYSSDEMYYSCRWSFYEFLTGNGFYSDTDDSGNVVYDYDAVISTALKDKSGSEWMKIIDSEIEKIVLYVDNFSTVAYYESILARYKQQLEGFTDKVKECEDKLAKGGLSDEAREKTELELEHARCCVSAYESVCAGAQILVDRDVRYGKWEFNTFSLMLTSGAATIEYSLAMTMDEYGTTDYDVYQKYLESVNESREQCFNAIKLALYSLEHKIPFAGALDSSAKTEWTNQFSFVAGLASIIFICFAGITVAQEYSSGTIRLLLIKPCKRTKIFTSKIMTLMIWWTVFVIYAASVLLPLNIMLFGFSDIMTSNLVIVFSEVIAIPAPVAALGVILEETLMAFFYISVALLFAVLTRKTVLAVAVPMAFSFVASTLQSIAMVLYSIGMKIMAYTPLFYLDFAPLRGNLADIYLQYTGGSMVLNLSGMFGSAMLGGSIYGGDVITLLGMFYFAAIITVAVWLSYTAFRKQKI